MNENILIGAVTVIISIVLNWFPKLKDVYDKQENWLQSVIMLVLVAVVALIIFGAKCAAIELPFVVWAGTCDQGGAKDLLNLYIAGVASGAVAFVALPKPK